MKDKYFTLANNIKIPAVGFGTWQISNSDVVDACLIALNSGYRILIQHLHIIMKKEFLKQ